MSLNRFMAIGNVGKDPEVKDLEGGNKVANFTLATTDRGYTNRNGVQVPDKTEWHNVVVWGGLAKVVEQYVQKGTKLYIEGKMRTRSYEDQSGQKKYVTEVYVDNLELLGSKEPGQTQPQQQAPSTTSYQPQQSPWLQQPPQQPQGTDDLPF